MTLIIVYNEAFGLEVGLRVLKQMTMHDVKEPEFFIREGQHKTCSFPWMKF
jgi:hypothetical protein